MRTRLSSFITQQLQPLTATVDKVAAVVPILTDAEGVELPVVSQSDLEAGLTKLRVAVTGQTSPPPATGWPMGNNPLYYRTVQLRTDLNALVDMVVQQLGPQAGLALSTAQAAHTQADANAAAIEVNRVGFEALKAWLTLVDAKAVHAQADADANKLALEAQQLYAQSVAAAQALTEAKTVVLQAQVAGNTAALATAQTQLAAVQAKADSTATAVVTAQAKAEQAAATAATALTAAQAAQASATTAINNAAAAQTTATGAQTSATAAQTALAAFIARFRSKRISTPQMAIGATVTVQVVWDTPFPDDKYNPLAQLEGGSILGLKVTATAHTATGCTVQIQNVLGVVLLAGAATIIAQALHD